MIILKGLKKDLGGFTVSRMIPQSEKRRVGPFVFLDHMGPFEVTDRAKMDVRPHPHIGLATVTYLFSGSGWHRDSIGSDQIIRPGDINWMTAGKRIVHSERTPSIAELGEKMEGLQIWVALPKESEELDPSFTHYPSHSLPEWRDNGVHYKLLIGSYENQTSPVVTYSPTLYLDLRFDHSDENFDFKIKDFELGVYVIKGSVTFETRSARLAKSESDSDIQSEDSSTSVHAGEIAILEPGLDGNWRVEQGSHLMVIGGAPLESPRYIYWNFVHSNPQKIIEAAQWWNDTNESFVEGETDRIPLPDHDFKSVIERLRPS